MRSGSPDPLSENSITIAALARFPLLRPGTARSWLLPTADRWQHEQRCKLLHLKLWLLET